MNTAVFLRPGIDAWLNEIIGAGWDLQPLAGDASFRRYLRLTLPDSQRRILMDAPPDKENCEPFVRIARFWHRHGVAVPEILAWSPQLGAMLLEDFGDDTLAAVLVRGQGEPWYPRAVQALLSLQALPDTPGLPHYDARLLRQEIDLFEHWLIEHYLGLAVPAGLRPLLDGWYQRLLAQALAAPQVTVHRDYHSRNLMITQDHLGIIDFQDAVIGPLTYDLVSLLKDCYQQLPGSLIDQLFHDWYAGLPATLQQQRSASACREDFELMGMQRHLKAAGIFARLSLRDGKHGYLEDIPNTLSHLQSALAAWPQWADIADWLGASVQPALAASRRQERTAVVTS